MERDPLVGRVLGGRYRLDELIGRGGFGAVYRAQQLALERSVAIKINIHVHRPSLAARFKREARVMARLSHPGCVTLLDYGEEDDGLIYMVQEYVDGQSVRELLDAEGHLDPPRAIHIVDGVLSALAAAHRLGIIHRDIKPSNIMISAAHGEEEVRVLDFGIAKIFDSELDVTRLTESGRVIGTPAYMAPEQIRSLDVSPRTDLYAAGVLLFHLLTGRKPFEGSSVFDIYRHHLETPPPTAAGRLSPALSAFIDRAMAKEPQGRFDSAAAMRESLKRAADGIYEEGIAPREADTVESGPPPTMPPQTESASPTRLPRGLMLVSVLVLAALLLWLLGGRSVDPVVASSPLPVRATLDAQASSDAVLVDMGADAISLEAAPPDAGPGDATVDVGRDSAPPDATPTPKAVKKRGPSWRALLRRGKGAESRGQFDEAEKAFKEAARLAPRRAEPRVALGRLYHQRGRLELALESLAEAYRLDPGSEEALYYYGLAYMQRSGKDDYLYLYRTKFPSGKYRRAVDKHIGAAIVSPRQPLETQ